MKNSNIKNILINTKNDVYNMIKKSNLIFIINIFIE